VTHALNILFTPFFILFLQAELGLVFLRFTRRADQVAQEGDDAQGQTTLGQQIHLDLLNNDDLVYLLSTGLLAYTLDVMLSALLLD
jgi:hypothetical protein